MNYKNTAEEIELLLDSLAFECKNLPREARFLAGKAFVHYRRRKGTKGNMLPDFFIGAHAAPQVWSTMVVPKGVHGNTLIEPGDSDGSSTGPGYLSGRDVIDGIVVGK